MFNFEKLDVWQKAIDFAALVYNHTRSFPADEQGFLTEDGVGALYSGADEIGRMLSGLRKSLLSG